MKSNKHFTGKLEDLPTVFRGVSFDDGWEFDCPTIIYYPIQMYRIGGGNEVEALIEDYMIDVSLGESPKRKLSPSAKKEFRWRGWDINKMAQRRKAYHTTVRGHWEWQEDKWERFPMFITDSVKTAYWK